MDMNVMMVGFAGTGKTSYMGALYNLFGRKSIGGFSIKASDENDHNALLRIGSGLAKGIYPSSTDTSSEYEFKLQYNYESILNFNWSDYRGGVLAESSNAETKGVVSKILNSDALIIFLDITGIAESDPEQVSIVNSVSSLIQNALSNLPEDSNFPISIVLTKFDRLIGKSSLGESLAFEKLLQVMEGIRESKNICGLLTFTIIGAESSNFHYPFFFSMFYGILKQKALLIREQNYKAESFKQNAENISLWDGFKSWVNNEASYREIAMDKYNECVSLEKTLEELEEPLESIKEFLLSESEDKDNLLWLF